VSLGKSVVQTQEQRETLCQKLYSLVSLTVAQGDDTQAKERPVRFLSFVDVLPEQVTQHIVLTIKSAINNEPSLQDLVAANVQRDIKRLDELQKSVKNVQASRFAELVVEPLLKFQNTRQVVVFKQVSEHD